MDGFSAGFTTYHTVYVCIHKNGSAIQLPRVRKARALTDSFSSYATEAKAVSCVFMEQEVICR